MVASAFLHYMAQLANARESCASVDPSNPTAPRAPMIVLDTDMTREEWTSTLRKVETVASEHLELGIDPWAYKASVWPYSVSPGVVV